MKKSFLVISILALVFGAVSCRKVVSEIPEKYKAVEQLQLDGSASVEFSAAGGNQYVKVVGNVGTLSVESSSNWVITEVEGQNIILSAGSNETLNIRYATLTITSASGKARTMQVKQFGVDNSYLWEETYEVPASGQELLLHFLPTMETVRLQVTGREWITAEMDYTSIKLTIAKNTKDEDRTGTITWQAGEDVRSFNIVQAAGSGSGGSGDNPGGDGEVADGSYNGYLGTWTDASGNTLRLEVYPEHEGEAYIAYYSGFAMEGEQAPFPAFYEDNAITFYSSVLYEYDEAPLMIYFCGFDADGYVELGGPEEDQMLAYSSLSNDGKSINIIGNMYKAVYGGTTYDEEIVKLMVRLYADSDYENYQAGYFYAIGMEDMNLPASFVKGGNSTSVNTRSVKNDFWTPFMKGSLWAPQTRRIR